MEILKHLSVAALLIAAYPAGAKAQGTNQFEGAYVGVSANNL